MDSLIWNKIEASLCCLYSGMSSSTLTKVYKFYADLLLTKISEW